MNDPNNREILTNAVNTVLNLTGQHKFRDSTLLTPLGADEYNIIEIAVHVEDQTGVNIFYCEETEKIHTGMSKLTFGEILKRLEDGKK